MTSVFLIAGTDADSSSKPFSDEQARLERSQPTVNRVYEMLRAIPGPHNQTLGNMTHSTLHLISSFSAEDDADEGSNVTHLDGRGSGESNISLKDGAQAVERKVASDKRGRKRAVSVVRAEAADAAEAAVAGSSAPPAERRRQSGEAGTGAPPAERRRRPSEAGPGAPPAERRRRPGEAGSSAPLLNYIFDAYSNTHHQHHRNDR